MLKLLLEINECINKVSQISGQQDIRMEKKVNLELSLLEKKRYSCLKRYFDYHQQFSKVIF